MVLGKVHDNWNEHWEGFLFVRLQDVQEVVILKETHSSVGNLQVITTNALHNALEEALDQRRNLLDLANLEHLLEFGQEERLLYTIREGPILE